MANRRVTLRPRRILVLGAFLLCLLRLQQKFVKDFEHVPCFSVSFSLAVPFLKTRSALVRVSRTCPRTMSLYFTSLPRATHSIFTLLTATLPTFHAS